MITPVESQKAKEWALERPHKRNFLLAGDRGYTRYIILETIILLALGAVLIWIDISYFLLYFLFVFNMAVNSIRDGAIDRWSMQVVGTTAYLVALAEHYNIPKEEIEKIAIRVGYQVKDVVKKKGHSFK